MMTESKPEPQEAHIPPTKMEKLAYALLKILEDHKERGSAEAAEIEAEAFDKVFEYDKRKR